MGKKLLNFDPINAEAGDFVYGGRSGRSPEEEMRIPVENLSNAGVSLTAGRLTSQELVSGTLSVTGWHTIAELDNLSANGGSTIISVFAGGSSRRSSMKILVDFTCDSTARDHTNTKIEILDHAYRAVSQICITGVRIAKSDSVIDAGSKLQINVDIFSSILIQTQLGNNLGNNKGWELVTPFLDNTPTLPDGVTVGIFLEAGEELSFETSATLYFPDWIASKQTNDTIRCSAVWSEIPKQGTNIVLTLPSVSLYAVDGAGTNVVISGSHTISNFVIDGKHIVFFINETGVFTTLNIGLVGLKISGTGCKLTIT